MLPVINEISTFKIAIPSTKEKLEFRPYYVKEEKALLIAYESQDQEQILSCLKNIIIACCVGTISVDRLTLFDLEYIFTQLRAKSVGETSQLRIKCQGPGTKGGEEKCETPNDITINLLDIKLDKLPDNNIKLSENFTAVLRYPSYLDAKEITTSKEDITAVDLLFNVTARCIDHIKGPEERFDFSEYTLPEIEDWLNKLKPIQLENMLNFIKDIPEMYYDVEYTCTKCGHVNKHKLKGITDFF